MTNALGYAVDSGAFAETFDKALAAADLPGFPARRQDSETRGLLRGLGFACHIKATGGNPSENVDIRFEDDGSVLLITGTQTIGQGHETTFPQILAHCLGIPNDRVRLVQGDTSVIRAGGGHGSSRATYMGGTAIFRASEEIVAKGRPIAASMLEAAEADIGFADGAFSIRRDRSERGFAGCRGEGSCSRHAARYLSLLDAGAHDVPQRHACRGGRDRSRHRTCRSGAAYRGRRLRRHRQSDDRVRSGAWRDRPGIGSGIDGTRGVRRGDRSMRQRIVHGLHHAAGGRFSGVQSGTSTTRDARPIRLASKAAARRRRSACSRRSTTRWRTRSAATGSWMVR